MMEVALEPAAHLPMNSSSVQERQRGVENEGMALGSQCLLYTKSRYELGSKRNGRGKNTAGEDRVISIE